MRTLLQQCSECGSDGRAVCEQLIPQVVNVTFVEAFRVDVNHCTAKGPTLCFAAAVHVRLHAGFRVFIRGCVAPDLIFDF